MQSSDSVVSIGSHAFAGNDITKITIGANVRLGEEVFPHGFDDFYRGDANESRAGTFIFGGYRWKELRD